MQKVSGIIYCFMSKNNFKRRVLKAVSLIPKGQTKSYKDIASIAGSPRAYRAAGNILGKNYDKNIPCHRVIRSNGKIGGYNRGIARKKQILKTECRAN